MLTRVAGTPGRRSAAKVSLLVVIAIATTADSAGAVRACPSHPARQPASLTPHSHTPSWYFGQEPLRAFTREKDQNGFDRAVTSTLDAIRTHPHTTACPPAPAPPAAPVELRSAPGTDDSPPQLDPLTPVTYAPGVIVPVSGSGVTSGQEISIAGQWSPIDARPGGGLGFALPIRVVAGTREAVLGAVPASGELPAPIPGTSPQPLTVRPAISSVSFESGQVRVSMAPAAQPGQALELGLFAVSPSAGHASASAALRLTAIEATTELMFPLTPSLPSGSYLAILTVDGVASIPDYENGAYTGPVVQIP